MMLGRRIKHALRPTWLHGALMAAALAAMLLPVTAHFATSKVTAEVYRGWPLTVFVRYVCTLEGWCGDPYTTVNLPALLATALLAYAVAVVAAVGLRGAGGDDYRSR